MRTLTLFALVLLVAPTIASPPEAAATRLVVDVGNVGEASLAEGLTRSQSDLLRRDDRLGLAVVETTRPDILIGVVGRANVETDGAAHVASGEPNDPLYADQWALQMLNMPGAWALEPGRQEVRVGVVDSGVRPDHPDLAPGALVLGYDYVDGDNRPLDEAGHGTHVAGILAATRANGVGVAGMANVTLVVLRVFDAHGSGWCSDVASAIVDSVEAGARIVNFSGWCADDLKALRRAVDWAADAGALVVSIAGNFQDDLDPLNPTPDQGPARCQAVYPAAYPEVMAVAAYGQAFGRAVPALYSCASIHVEVAAPGNNIVSTWLGDGYAIQSGTSMAAAHVSATAALVLSANGALTGAEVRNRVIATARDLGTPGWDPVYGHGTVDPVAALGPTGRGTDPR